MPIRGVESVRPGAHASLHATETGFRIDQELPGGYDLLTFLTLMDSLAQRFFESHRGLRAAVELLAQKD